MNLEEIQVKHIAPVEFEDGIMQFLLTGKPGVIYEINTSFAPAILWIYSEKIPYLHKSVCSCLMGYRFTKQSVLWWAELTGVPYSPSIPVTICPCEGKILE